MITEGKRRGRPPGYKNPNAGRKPGGENPNAGRRYKTRFAIPPPIVSNVERSTADVTISYCNCCPAVWWEPCTVTRWGKYQEEPDEQGNHWPILETVTVEGQPEIHQKGCLAK